MTKRSVADIEANKVSATMQQIIRYGVVANIARSQQRTEQPRVRFPVPEFLFLIFKQIFFFITLLYYFNHSYLFSFLIFIQPDSDLPHTA